MKQGYKTTEFWVTLAGLLVSALLAFNLVTQDQAERLTELGIALAPLAVVVGTYVAGRSYVKSKE